jgi:hypothetical protein
VSQSRLCVGPFGSVCLLTTTEQYSRTGVLQLCMTGTLLVQRTVQYVLIYLVVKSAYHRAKSHVPNES